MQNQIAALLRAVGIGALKFGEGILKDVSPDMLIKQFRLLQMDKRFSLQAGRLLNHHPPVGLYLGKINSGVITIIAGDTTSSTSWTQLGVQSAFPLELGDTAIVLLDGGLAGGPFQGYGYFDLINLQQSTGINFLDQNQSLKLYPNPFNNQTTLRLNQSVRNASITISNSFGQVVRRIENINGHTIVLDRDNLKRGLYVMCLTENKKIIAQTKLFVTDE